MSKDTIPINEIFYSISGEGLSMGTPAVFIRVAGCNFAERGHPCLYCDTVYAQHQTMGYENTIESIILQVSQYPARLVIITGGEPLCYYAQVKKLATLLLNSYNVEIETNGSFKIWIGKPAVRWSLDIKTPCSGNQKHNEYSNLPVLNEADQVKFVIASKEDFDFAVDLLRHWPCKAHVFFQPSYGVLDPTELAEWIKQMPNPAVRLGIQSHKILYGQRRGV